MKSVLISIQPKWCELIASGKKTVEVRKSRPKIETPFKCYIYCTGGRLFYEDFPWNGSRELKLATYNFAHQSLALNGKVIGEFVCDEVIKDERGEYADVFVKQACLSLEEQKAYGGNKPLYGWHISDLKIYDKPRELGEFFVKGECENFDNCRFCPYFHKGEGWLDGSTCDEDDCELYGFKPLTHAPKSWCYAKKNRR